MVVNGGNSQQQPTTAPPPPPDVNNIMGGIEQTVGVRMHNHRRKLRQRFDLVRKLGQGTYGKVQLGINKETGQEVAIKTIKKAKIETEADLIRIRREIQIMSSVRHPNIIHIYEVFENKEKMVLVMEYAAGGELYDYLSQRKVLNETEARRVFRQVASAVYYCHKHNICHRDLKLENILLDESKTAKIADFGLSNVFDDRRLLTTFCGSPLYASPEIVRGTPYHGPEVDCWSLGVLLYTLVYGAMPFDGSNFKRLVKQISSGEYYEPPDKPSTASPLVRHMLLVDPTKRANVEDICSHWWVNEGYGESCLEVAEELANQTPVRLDLLLSLVPPPESTDTVVVSAKNDQTASTVSKEGDSMNEYYSAAEPSSSDAAKTGGVKKKKESSGQSEKDIDKVSTVKRRRAESDQVKSIDDSTTPDGRHCQTGGELDAQISAGPSPIDDSGIQNSLREEEELELLATGVQSASEEVRTKTTSQAKPKCDVTDVDMDEGISTSSQADNRQSSVQVASCMANPATVMTPCTIMTTINPSQSSSPSANATSTTSTSSIPHCSSVSQQHSPTTSALRQTTVEVVDVDVSTSPMGPTANAKVESIILPPVGGPTCVPDQVEVLETPTLLVTSTGQPESQMMAVKMDAEGAVPAANVVTVPEPENTAAPSSTSPTTPPPPSLNQVPQPPPPLSTLAPEKIESAGDSRVTTASHTTTTTTATTKEVAEVLSTDSSNRSESSSAPNASTASVAVANRRPANTNKAAGPATAEQRHSKILRQAEIFNSLVLTHSRNEPTTTGPKSTMTLERPKKVTIFSYKLNDTRRPTETRTEPKVPTIVPVLKVSDAKRAFENNAAAAQQQRNASINSATSGHHHNSLPRRTLIQTPTSVSTDAMIPKSLNQQRAGHAASMAAVNATAPAAQEASAVEPGEKVVVGGLGVKIGAIGKVTEIGMKVKTEDQSENQINAKDTKISPVQKDESHVKPEGCAVSNEKKVEQSKTEQEVKVVTEPEVAPAVPLKKLQSSSTKEKVSKVKESEECPTTIPDKEQEESKSREIPVMLDTGELETKVASVLMAPGRSPPKDPPAAPRPTSLPTPVSAPSPPKSTVQVSSTATERTASPPPKPVRVASPTPQSPLRIASPPPRPVRIASPPPVATSKNVCAPARTMSPPPPLIRPLPDQSSVNHQRPLSPGSTLPLSRPMSPIYASSMTSTDRTEDDCIAGSENAFIRGIRSPTRDHPPAVPTLNKRFSKGSGDMPENAMVMVEAKPIQKAEINIAVNVASTSTNPRERIIPIRVEGRGETTAAVSAVGGLVTSDSNKAVKSNEIAKSLNSISVQLRATPPRVASPPPAQPIKPVPIRPSSASRQESMQNPGPALASAESANLESKKFIREPIRESAREPIRKSPREFIIPITVEGVGASHPATTETVSSSSASLRNSRFDRTKRYGSLYHEGDTDFDISQPSGDIDNHAASPLHHLQRLSSFKKSHDEPETSRGRRGSDSSIDDDIDDDDDTFQILTAESLFSTLLSRVRQLTKRNQRAENNAADPFVVFRNSSRFTSPATSTGGRSRATDVSDIHREFEDASSQMSTPGCTSPNAHHHHNNNNRNSTGSDLLTGSASNKGFWNNVYSRASSVASESDARRYSTLDPPRFHTIETPQLQQQQSAVAPSGLPWRRDTSVEGESNCSIASASMSQRGTAYHSPAVNGDANNATPASSRPFTSSLTRRKLNQHLRETNPELVGTQNGSQQQNNSDAMSDASSTSGGNRSSLSWALSRFTGGTADSARSTSRSVREQQQPQYNRTKSSRELGNEPQQRTYQRYGRSSTLGNLDPDTSTAPSSASTTGYFHRIGSPFSDDEHPNSGVSTPASYRTFTRTRSREYMSPTSSRGTSPVPSSSAASPSIISTTNVSSPDAMATMNPIVPQLSTVLENGPLGVEGESSPRPIRAAESKLAAITSLNSVTTNPIPASVTAPLPAQIPTASNPTAAPATENADGTIERKSRRVSRFLRPDFYDAPKDDSSSDKQRFLKSVEQRWEKYNPDAGLMALSKTTNKDPAAGSTQTIERPSPIQKDRTSGSVTSTPPSPLQPILKARQSLTPIPAPAQPNLSLPPPISSVVLKPVSDQPQVEPIPNTKIPQQVTLKSVEPQQSTSKSNGNTPSSKSSPKLTVRRQFEHLINLAAAQFQRSSSPNKVAPAVPSQAPTSTTITPPTPIVSTAAVQQQTVGQQQPDTISLELKQLEDEIKNTAAIKAQASARLDALKYEHAVKSGAAAVHPSGIPKPAIPVKPIYLVAKPVQELPSISPDLSIVPPEFQPFQYKGSNGTLRELSHRSNNNRRDALSPPPAGGNETNGASISPFADEAVRFARIIKRFEPQPYDNSWASDGMGIDNAAPGTPTDSYESSSVCSDLRGDQRDSGEDESVSERIFRKSFYSRFNEPTKTKHLRSMNRELTADGVEGGEGNLPITEAQPPISRRSSQHRKSISGREESVDRMGLSESVMVRKFLSSGDANGGGTFDRERRLSATRRHPTVSEYSDAPVDVIHPRRSMSREVSVARSVKSDTQPSSQQQVTSPTPSIAGSDSGDRGTNGREVRSYARTYSSSRALANDLPPSGNGESYSSASLGRRSYYPVSSTSSSSNADHISSLPRRSSNRYSIHEHVPESTNVRLRSTGSSILASRPSRYSSILLEESGSTAGGSATGHQISNVLSPNSTRRHTNLSDSGLTRRESTFYGTPSSLSSRPREGSTTGSTTSTYFLRSTSSGLDHHNNNSTSNHSGSGTYSTLRPSLLRHRR